MTSGATTLTSSIYIRPVASTAQSDKLIRSYRDKETEKIVARDTSRKLPPDIQQTARRKLWLLATTFWLDELRVPNGNWLEELNGCRKGIYSVFSSATSHESPSTERTVTR